MQQVLSTITNSPYGFGGVSTWIEQTTLTLPAHGWQVTTMTHALDQQHLADWASKHPGIHLDPIYGRYARLNEISPALEKYLDRVRPKVVLVNGSYWTLPTIQKRKQRGENIRTIGICHADENGYYIPLAFYRDAFDYLIGVSRTCTETLIERGCAPEKIGLLPYGVTCPEQLPPRTYDGPLRLVYVGRLVQSQKRILDFIPLLEALNARQVNYRLDFYGAGQEEEILRAQVRALDNDERVFFHGWIPATQVSETAWGNADIFVLPSAYEGLSISMLEAMGHGVVPIVSRVQSGSDHVIREGETGFTFPIGELTTCADQIAMLDHARAKLAEISSSAHTLVQQEYSTARHTQKLSAILDMVMNRPPELASAPYMGVTSNPFARLIPGKAIVYARRLLKRGNQINEGYTTFP